MKPFEAAGEMEAFCKSAAGDVCFVVSMVLGGAFTLSHLIEYRKAVDDYAVVYGRLKRL